MYSNSSFGDGGVIGEDEERARGSEEDEEHTREEDEDEDGTRPDMLAALPSVLGTGVGITV